MVRFLCVFVITSVLLEILDEKNYRHPERAGWR